MEKLKIKTIFENMKDRDKKIVRRKKAIKMSAYKVTKKLAASICIALISFLGFVGVCIYSAIMKGNAGFIVGIVPLFLMLCNIVGLMIAYSEIKNENVKVKYVTIGTLSNGLILVVYLFMYIVGSLDIIR